MIIKIIGGVLMAIPVLVMLIAGHIGSDSAVCFLGLSAPDFIFIIVFMGGFTLITWR
jgi:hypothetical protein